MLTMCINNCRKNRCAVVCVMNSFDLPFISFLLSMKPHCKKTSDFGQPEPMPGKIETYFVKGYKEKAQDIQMTIEDAVHFYEKLLKDTFSSEHFVLNKKSWKKYANTPYPIPHYINSEKRMLMLINGFYKIQFRA
jgi:hypothetical protein